MIKRTIFFMLLSLVTTSAFSQSSSSANQIIQLQLNPAIEITTVTAANIQMGFNTTNQYANGVTSAEQKFNVKSNENFVITVKTDANNFSYTGTTYPSPIMPVNNILFMSVTSNSTGGNTSGSFASGYESLSATPKQVLVDCKSGGNNMFAVNYKATPQNYYPAGTYTVNVIYTATQQ